MIDGVGRGAPPRVRMPGETGARGPAVPEPVARNMPARFGGIVRDMAASPPVDVARVEALRTAIASGSYKADPEAIAARMLAFGRR